VSLDSQPARRRGRALRLLGAVATDIRPLREHRDYRLLWAGNLVSVVGRQITIVALPYQVFLITHSSLAVGAIGLVQLVPLVVLSLWGGALADRFDRRIVLVLDNLGMACCSLALCLGAFGHWSSLPYLYVVAGLSSGFSAVDQPTRTATIPNLVSTRNLPSAIALNISAFTITVIVGPAVGGVIVATAGVGAAYLVDVVTFTATIAAALAIAPQPPLGGRREPVLRSIQEGLVFTFRQRIVLGGYALDLVAMVFGMRRALYPVLATQVYRQGPVALGLLSSALGVGAMLAALTSGWVSQTRWLGRVVVVMVAGWGLTVIALGLAPSLWWALGILAVGGATDSWSAVARSTAMQMVTPDRLRGRVSAVYSMVVVGGPSLGDIESGSVASLASPAVSIVSGGIAVLAGVGLIRATMPELWRYRADRGAVPRPETLTGPGDAEDAAAEA
jgi:MFS family permease